MKEIYYKEFENGSIEISDIPTDKRMDMLEEISREEFKEKFPDVSDYGLNNYMPVYLENGIILISTEWFSDEYRLADGSRYRPVYRTDEDGDSAIIGYYTT